MKKMIGIPMRLCAKRESTLGSQEMPGAVSQAASAGFASQRRSLLRELLSSVVSTGADWWPQLDRAWEDCKSRNFLAAEQQWSGRASERARSSNPLQIRATRR